jgi:hypothetical protein
MQRPAKPSTSVRFRVPPPLPMCLGSRYGDVAQLGERRVRNAKVGSSILLVSTNKTLEESIAKPRSVLTGWGGDVLDLGVFPPTFLPNSHF